jgi:hypothetical protein
MEEEEVQASIEEGEAMGLFVRRGDRHQAHLRMGAGGTYLNWSSPGPPKTQGR